MTISRVYSGNTTGIHKYLIRNRDKKRGKQKTKIWTIELRQKHDESEESNCVDKLERSSGVVIGQERERERERAGEPQQCHKAFVSSCFIKVSGSLNCQPFYGDETDFILLACLSTNDLISTSWKPDKMEPAFRA